MSLWRRLDLEKKCIKPGVLKIILERGVEVLRANKCEVTIVLVLVLYRGVRQMDLSLDLKSDIIAGVM